MSDTSEKYIKMADCPKIQDKQPDEYETDNVYAIFTDKTKCIECNFYFERADIYCTACGKKLDMVREHYINFITAESADHVVWLPRFGQLHILSGWRWGDFLAKCINVASADSGMKMINYFKYSMEVAGIEVVMRNHEKQWSDEKGWIVL